MAECSTESVLWGKIWVYGVRYGAMAVILYLLIIWCGEPVLLNILLPYNSNVFWNHVVECSKESFMHTDVYLSALFTDCFMKIFL